MSNETLPANPAAGTPATVDQQLLNRIMGCEQRSVINSLRFQKGAIQIRSMLRRDAFIDLSVTFLSYAVPYILLKVELIKTESALGIGLLTLTIFLVLRSLWRLVNDTARRERDFEELAATSTATAKLLEKARHSPRVAADEPAIVDAIDAYEKLSERLVRQTDFPPGDLMRSAFQDACRQFATSGIRCEVCNRNRTNVSFRTTFPFVPGLFCVQCGGFKWSD